MHKVCSDKLTSDLLSGYSNGKICEFIATDQAFSFISCIKRTLAYWKKILLDVLPMVKHKGIPILLLALSCQSCADLSQLCAEWAHFYNWQVE